jgi:hypothetical protein
MTLENVDGPWHQNGVPTGRQCRSLSVKHSQAASHHFCWGLMISNDLAVKSKGFPTYFAILWASKGDDCDDR